MPQIPCKSSNSVRVQPLTLKSFSLVAVAKLRQLYAIYSLNCAKLRHKTRKVYNALTIKHLAYIRVCVPYKSKKSRFISVRNTLFPDPVPAGFCCTKNIMLSLAREVYYLANTLIHHFISVFLTLANRKRPFFSYKRLKIKALWRGTTPTHGTKPG